MPSRLASSIGPQLSKALFQRTFIQTIGSMSYEVPVRQYYWLSEYFKGVMQGLKQIFNLLFLLFDITVHFDLDSREKPIHEIFSD